jgi:D-serine deaminase-like pyridoxal phosphate-dependent protein
LPPLGLRGPTEDEIAASRESSARAPRVVAKGVYRYRSHAQANADTERWAAEALVARGAEMRAKSGVGSGSTDD